MTIRVDTLRNRMAATRALLHELALELNDLHALAYERHHQPAEAKVQGGERDYALDNHGDPVARAAYRELADATVRACDNLALALGDTRAILRAGDTTSRHARVHWTAGHVNAGEAGGRLEPECSVCNYGHGARLGNRLRRVGDSSAVARPNGEPPTVTTTRKVR